MKHSLESFIKKDFLPVLAIFCIIFLTYFPSINREWLPFDEGFIYKEELTPIPRSLSEIFEIIKYFALNTHVVSTNSFFSNLVNVRCNPLATSLHVIISYFFQKTGIFYHSFQLFIHFTNSILVYLIFKSISKENVQRTDFLPLCFALLWAVHSGISEAILLSTNLNTILTYTFCFTFILYELKRIDSPNKFLFLQAIALSVLFFILMCFTEYAYSLPLIVFFIILSSLLKAGDSFKSSVFTSIKRIAPYGLGLFAYIIFSLTFQTSPIKELFRSNNSLTTLFFERSFWLAPQIFVEFLKVFFFPKTLSTFHSNLLPLASSYFEVYSTICFLIYVSLFLTPLIFFKSRFKYILILFFSLYFAIFPYLQTLAPTYCLFAERYCYFPLFIFIMILFQTSLIILSKRFLSYKILVTGILICIIPLSIRTYIRTIDWKTPENFYLSAIKAEKKDLYKAQKLLLFGNFLKTSGKSELGEECINQSFNLFNQSLETLKTKSNKEPSILTFYGINNDSLLVKAAYCISLIKLYYLSNNESPQEILSFLNPYIEKRLFNSAPNEIAFYASLLKDSGNIENSLKIYEQAFQKYPFILEIALPLIDQYFALDPDKSLAIAERAYNYLPNKGYILHRLVKLYSLKGNLEKKAHFAYLLGLRSHSIEGYELSAQTYLTLNKTKEAKKAFDKLASLKRTVNE